jgi:hypothetical protein
MREIDECTRWFIGRCVVLCVCKLGVSLARDESKLGVGGCASALGDIGVCVKVV